MHEWVDATKTTSGQLAAQAGISQSAASAAIVASRRNAIHRHDGAPAASRRTAIAISQATGHAVSAAEVMGLDVSGPILAPALADAVKWAAVEAKRLATLAKTAGLMGDDHTAARLGGEAQMWAERAEGLRRALEDGTPTE